MTGPPDRLACLQPPSCTIQPLSCTSPCISVTLPSSSPAFIGASAQPHTPHLTPGGVITPPSPSRSRSQGPGSFDQGFVHPLPAEYPVRAPGRSLPSWEERREEAAPHVPSWLPAFPDRHTYVRAPAFPGHEEDPVKQSEVGVRGARGERGAWQAAQQRPSVHHQGRDYRWLRLKCKATEQQPAAVR